MTDTATPADPTEHAEADEHHADGHASDTLYIQVALILAVITGAEITLPYIIEDGPWMMFPLLGMMAIKFYLIGYFFMHLKFDNKVLTRVFYTGLFLAVGVYLIALTTFRIFGN